MDEQDPLLTAGQAAFQALLATAADVEAQAKLAFAAALKRQAALFDALFKRLEQQVSGGGSD